MESVVGLKVQSAVTSVVIVPIRVAVTTRPVVSSSSYCIYVVLVGWVVTSIFSMLIPPPAPPAEIKYGILLSSLFDLKINAYVRALSLILHNGLSGCDSNCLWREV